VGQSTLLITAGILQVSVTDILLHPVDNLLTALDSTIHHKPSVQAVQTANVSLIHQHQDSPVSTTSQVIEFC